MDDKKIKKKANVLLCVISILLLCILLFPLYWTLITSLKTEKEIFRNPPSFFPNIINTKSYGAQVSNGDFNMFRSFGNSFIISCGAMVIAARVFNGRPAFGVGHRRAERSSQRSPDP